MADFRPLNILLGLQDLDGLEEDYVLELLGEPETVPLCMSKDSYPTPENPWVPERLVYKVDFEDNENLVILSRVHLIDFGQSFDTSQPPPAKFGIPANYAAPEVILDQTAGKAMDLWSRAVLYTRSDSVSDCSMCFNWCASASRSTWKPSRLCWATRRMSGCSTASNQRANLKRVPV